MQARTLDWVSLQKGIERGSNGDAKNAGLDIKRGTLKVWKA